MLFLKLEKNRIALNMWSILSLIFVTLIVLPNLNIFINLFNPANDNWQHIREYLLKDYLVNSLKLIFFTSIFTIFIGTSLAWLISAYDFPLKGFFKWALILPLAIPPNIAAYTYNGLLDYTGVIQTYLRNQTNVKVSQKYFDIMNIHGAIFIFTLFLFPYVYTITKSFLEKQSSSLIESARVLGRKPLDIFFTIVLPIARTAIIGGVSLVILEVLNDYGVVEYFGIPTFSTAIFKSWFAMGDLNSAVRLSSILMLMVFIVLMLENLLRGRKKYSFSSSKIRPIIPQKLTGLKGVLAFKYCLIVFSFSFIIPVAQLIFWGTMTYKKILDAEFWKLMLNSVSLAVITTILIVIIALVIANYSRISEGLIAKFYSKITILGYSIPGAIIAIGVIVFFIGIDKNLYWLYKLFNPESRKLLLTTSLVVLVFAYNIRFLAIGFNSIEAGFEKMGKKFFEASRTLGMNTWETFLKVDLPMLKPAILSSCVLVFVDILKELPLTLLLRPFNFDTIATKVFMYASDERVHEAAIPSLVIIAISFISIYFFHRVGAKEEN